MATADNTIPPGHYAKKQLLCKDWLIAWSHRSRFRMGIRLARQFAGKQVLDYGCGDGTFLGALMADAAAPATAVGAEIHHTLVTDCRRRIGDRPGLRFVLVDELDGSEHRGAYDGVICMEVLEHVVDIAPVLDRLDALLAPSGSLLISVPVEIGVPLVLKQAVRQIAGWRGLGDYPGTSAYTLLEYYKSVVAGCCQHLERPLHRDAHGHYFHDHKGFNWKRLRQMLAQRFVLEQTVSSPLPWLPPHLASQVWFVARKA